MVEHNMRVVARLADRVTVLAAGRVLAEGGYHEVRSDQRVIDAYLERAMLRIDGLSAAYGEAVAVREVSLRVDAGEIVTLVGRNGAGKTTLLRTIMGVHPHRTGRIEFGGTDITGLAPHRRPALASVWVPDDRGAYATLTVDESLTLSPVHASGGWTRERIYDTFPRSPNAVGRCPIACPAVSSRCSRWPGSCGPVLGCCCAMSRPKVSRRCSSARSATCCTRSRRAVSVSYWSNRTCISRRPSPTAHYLLARVGSSRSSTARICRPVNPNS